MAAPSIAQLDSWLAQPRVKALLDLIAYTEGTTQRGYADYYAHARTLDTSKGHPNVAIRAGGYTSTAAGRYQILGFVWREFVGVYPSLSIMTPQNQDRFVAWRSHVTRGALSKILAGDLKGALEGNGRNGNGLAYEWASFWPGRHGQGFKSLAQMTQVYNAALAKHGGQPSTDIQNLPPGTINAALAKHGGQPSTDIQNLPPGTIIANNNPSGDGQKKKLK